MRIGLNRNARLTHSLALAFVLLGACSSSAGGEASSTTRPRFDSITTVTTGFDPITTTTENTPVSTTAAPFTTTTAAPVPPSADGLALVDALVIAPEHLGGYDRDRFEHWSDVDRNGCNTRCEVLAEERRPDVGWVSIYDGFVTADRSRIEIDHVVALAEAWRSGAWAWDDARREAFANDLDDPDALVAVSSASNQSKADKDPAEWRPRLESAWCWWASASLRVKVKWGLTADQREVDAFRTLLADC